MRLVIDERPLLLYLDQNYLSGIVKRKPGFRELEPSLRAAVARGAVGVPEAEAHRIESGARPDLPLLELLGELSRGLRLPDRPGARERQLERRLAVVVARDFPERRGRESDRMDLRALALALPAAGLRPAMPSWPTSSAAAVCTSGFAASSTPAVAPTSTGCGSGSSACRQPTPSLRSCGARKFRRWQEKT